MQNPIQSNPSHKGDYRKSIQNNIKQTHIALDQIKHYQHNHILPFSLRQQHNHTQLNSSQSSIHDLGHSNLSEKLHHLSAKTTHKEAQVNHQHSHQHSHQNNPAQISTEPMNSVHPQYSHSQQHTRKHYPNTQDQQNIQGFCNKNPSIQASGSSKIQVQVHLTIAKKKFTLKLSSLISSQQLAQVVQQFLIQNNISNPSKKNHLKTKNSIIQMVLQKLHQSQHSSYQNQTKSSPIKGNSPNKNIKQTIDNDKNSAQMMQVTDDKMIGSQQDFELKNSYKNDNKINKNSRKFERPMIKQISRASVGSQRSQEGCSPSFKESEYVSKSPLVKTSNFSPEPKNKQNKYQRLVSNYYNDRVNGRPNYNTHQSQYKPNQNTHQSYTGVHQSYQRVQAIQRKDNVRLMKENPQRQPINQTHLQLDNISSLDDSSPPINDQSTSTPKSVYEKWKLKQRSKQNPKPTNQSLQNPLKQKKPTQNPHKPVSNKPPTPNQRLSNNHQRSSNSINQTQKLKETPHSKSPNKLSQNKWIKKINDQFMSKSIHNTSTNNLNQQKSLNKTQKFNQKQQQQQKQNHQHNTYNLSKHENRSLSNIKKPVSKTPTKNLNKTQIFNDKSQHSSYSPYQQMNQFSSDVSPLKPKRSTYKSKNLQDQRQSQIYTIHDEQFPSGHHQPFQMSPDHFYKQGLLFQAKKQQEISHKFNSIYPFTTRNQQIHSKSQKITQNSNIQSRQKYFSSKNTNQSSTNLPFTETQKSALHERLYKEDKDKKMKQVEIQANKKIFKMPKTPTPQIQINLMQQNLKKIKGLSQQKKIKLMQKNISIKEKIREKDKLIDQELQKMIKQGKVKPACEIVTLRKSPFRKTQLF